MDSLEFEARYRSINRGQLALIVAAAVVTLAMGFFFITIGMEQGSWQPIRAFKAYLDGTLERGPTSVADKIILLLRIPRIAMAIIAGFGLAISGAVMQSVTRNPLVSPFTLGLSSAAAFGASLCIVFGSGPFFESESGIITSAFICSLLCVIIVYTISKAIGISPTVIILVGISLNYFFSALTAGVEFFSKNHELESVVQWTFGTLNRSNWNSVVICGPMVLLGFIVIYSMGLKLDAIALNDDETVKSLGINPERIRAVSGLMAALLTSTIISFTGIIGFVGLIGPHMARIIIGNRHKFFIPMAGFLGAILLFGADTVGRLIIYPVYVPVGIIISVLGVPIFIHLILSAGREKIG
ncbi:MAG: iron ABC transporter permease [Deltaproteobacteria bacterium]|jgi:iron complex transport system permease protein|nr:iron ABC transporter permease [Deltaproteobacteria bacterium]